MKISTKQIAVSALLVAADVVLTRLLAINTPVMKIGFGFLAVAIAGALYGPWWAALLAALADLIGSLAFPTGAYFPGFTLTAAVSGLLYGFFLYRKPLDVKHGLLAAIMNVLLVSFAFNTAMISYLGGTPYFALLKVRAVQLLIMLPLQSIILILVLPRLLKKISNYT